MERPRKASVQLWAKQQPFFERPTSVGEVVLELGEALVTEEEALVEDVDVVILDVVVVVVVILDVVAVAVAAALGGAAHRLLAEVMELRDSMDHDKTMKWMFSLVLSYLQTLK